MTNLTINITTAQATEIAKQIGKNIWAISGGRIGLRKTGLTLPVGCGYSVEVDLCTNDTYTVKRVFKRGAKVTVKGQVEDVYCDQVSEVAYRASCFRSYEFGI